MGHFSYYWHEDSKGEKVEYRNSKQIHLKVEETESDLDSVTTPILTTEMKSEYRDRVDDSGIKDKLMNNLSPFQYGVNPESILRHMGNYEQKDKRKTMIQPPILQLSVWEEASISMEQSPEHESETEGILMTGDQVNNYEPAVLISNEQGQ